jgi:hypothetical protein
LEKDCGERVVYNPLWEMAEHVVRHFESCRRTIPTYTMAVFVLPKRAMFSDLTRHWKLRQKFYAKTHMLIRESVNDPSQHEGMALRQHLLLNPHR